MTGVRRITFLKCFFWIIKIKHLLLLLLLLCVRFYAIHSEAKTVVINFLAKVEQVSSFAVCTATSKCVEHKQLR